MQSSVLKSITALTKDGEWGKGEPFDSSVAMVVIRGTDFADARVGLLSNVPIRHIPEHIALRKRLQAFDILIETAGGTKDQPTGRTLLVKPSLLSKTVLPLTCASFARFIRIDQTKADPTFVFWLLQSLYNAGLIRQYHTQHTGVARFQFTTFAEREPLPLPPINAQKHVASILSAYDDLIENNTRRIKVLEAMAQMIYREWFVNFRFPGHEDVRMVESELGPIPEGWAVATLEAVCQRITDGSHWSPPTVDSTYRMASSKDMHRWGLNLSSARTISKDDFDSLVRNDCKPLEGDILITKDGANYLKFCFVIEKDIEVVLLSSIAMVRPDPGRMRPHLLAFYLTDPSVKTRLAGRVSGAAIPRIVLKDFRQFTMLLPPMKIQIAFEQIVGPIVGLCWRLTDKNANLQITRDLLLPKLISGAIPVEAAEEFASEIIEATA